MFFFKFRASFNTYKADYIAVSHTSQKIKIFFRAKVFVQFLAL